MAVNLSAFGQYQVFLNYPFDEDFESLSHALHFAVIAAGLLPVCALDITTPDRPRLELIVEMIKGCQYSAHDFSRGKGEGRDNFARMNMPIEVGMALFHALQTQRMDHRCAFFVEKPHDYHAFASDLAGLDPKCYDGDELILVAHVFDWLRAVVPLGIFNPESTVAVRKRYAEFKLKLPLIAGSGNGGKANHHEAKELMYQICGSCGWWEWRNDRKGKVLFPELPLIWKP